jgi:O-methyltransferase
VNKISMSHLRSTLQKLVLYSYYVLTLPVAIVFILSSTHIHPAYRMTFIRKMRLGFRLFLNSVLVPTATSYKTHLAMALKLLEMPPDKEGIVVECGTWKGGTATNLSLICRLVGRRLEVYDSFEGLPVGLPHDRQSANYEPGSNCGSLAEVKRNVARRGDIGRCEFIAGWFENTLPFHHEPVALAYLDVDLEASLECCVRHLWPRLVDGGHIFIDEASSVSYCSLFYSERYWKSTFNEQPPGMIGAGVGLALGEYYIGPDAHSKPHPLQHYNAGGYTRKGMIGYWSFFPKAEGHPGHGRTDHAARTSGVA